MDKDLKSYNYTPMTSRYQYETIPERLELMALKHPDKIAYIFYGLDGHKNVITAKELHKKTNQLAAALVHLGIVKGDVVATCLFNDLESLLSIFAIISAGGIVASLAMLQADGSDVQRLLQKLGARALIIDPGDGVFKGCKHFIDAHLECGKVKSKLVSSLQIFISTKAVDDIHLLTLGDLFEMQVHSRFPCLDPEDTYIYVATSGSTGQSKFAPHSHFSAMVNGQQLKESICYGDNDIIYNERRLGWTGGFPFMFLHDGATCVMKTTQTPNLADHCELTYRILVEEHCTHAGLFPATIAGLLDYLSTNPAINSSASPLLKNIHTGGLPVATDCMKALGRLTTMVTNCYGSCEAGFVSSEHVLDASEYIAHSAGFPHQGVEIKVVDKEGFPVPRMEQGEIHVRCASLFRFYVNDEEKTKEVLSVNHWMKTGDVGWMTKSGKIVVSGRASDIILQGGDVHIPSYTEAFLKTHPDVLDVVVIKIPDDSLFELACACILPKPGKIVTADDIGKFYNRNMLTKSDEGFSRFRPEVIEIFDSYPKLYSGKPDKVALKRLVSERRNKRSY